MAATRNESCREEDTTELGARASRELRQARREGGRGEKSWEIESLGRL